MVMSKERTVDEYLGFVHKTTEKEPSPATQADDDDAYEDSWYQVLKAKAEEAEVDEA
ncbi:MAG: hypothetical protein M3Q20_06510 [Actinomycetota bacterium]|nr:hypothetical protein [Actinomycetota bacterium]